MPEIHINLLNKTKRVAKRNEDIIRLQRVQLARERKKSNTYARALVSIVKRVVKAAQKANAHLQGAHRRPVQKALRELVPIST